MDYLHRLMQFVRIQDCLDILIVAYIIYKAIGLLRETRAMQLIKGIVVLLAIFQLSVWLQLSVLNYILMNTLQFGVIAMLIVFQPELRRGLEKVGRSKFGQILNLTNLTSPEEITKTIDIISESVSTLSKNRIGALIVIERKTKIRDIVRTGIRIDSEISPELLVNIFVPNTPLHDGAVVVRENRIMAAACFLPLTQNQDLTLEFGTRHRAALGMSETSDAVVIVVSEETGKISIALEGSLTRNLTPASLTRALLKILIPAQKKNKQARKMLLWKGRAG
ncbi:MAG: DNA integrity scanning protein DisA [Firmicutes bacterium ADurb.Bin193]|nr:MAG: DNA integrity scanning protein DisA [Firmicutes bacterium ADurb.Bin193]